MLAKLGAQIIVQLLKLLPGLAYKAFLGLREYLKQRKKKKALRAKAKEIQDETDSTVLRDSVDDLP